MGAAIAVTMATRQESLLAGLVLVGLGPRLTVDPDLLELTASIATTARAVDWVIERGFAPGTPVDRLSEARAQMMQISPDVLRRDFLACDRFEASGQLRSIRIPVRIVCGSLDRLTPPEECRRLAEAIPQAHFHLLPGAGHMVPIERPEEFASLIHEFMEQLR
jgi:pimeloyl-ACP methyl ester carboxylesterase